SPAVYDMTTGDLNFIVQPDETRQLWGAYWLPDGNSIVAAYRKATDVPWEDDPGKGLALIDPKTFEIEWVPGARINTQAPYWTEDGRYIAYPYQLHIGDPVEIRVTELGTMTTCTLIESGGLDLAWGPA
ncbi:MAG: hypothetical protein AAF125_18175, partial [Chloroflexota bacterium]